VWSPDRPHWHVGLSTHQVVRARRHGLWPGRAIVCDSVDCLPAAQEAPWQAALVALGQWLAALDTRPPVLRVVLSGSLLRWQLLPWRPELLRAQEMAVYARLRFAETFGPVADTWQVLHAPQAPGRAIPACAVDAALLSALQTLCRSAKVRLDAVVPYFSHAADHWRGTLGKGATWFGLVEPQWLSLGLLHGGAWMALRSQRLDADWPSVLPGLMARMAMSTDGPALPARTCLVGAGVPPAAMTGMAGLPFQWLQPPGPAGVGTDARRMALGI